MARIPIIEDKVKDADALVSQGLKANANDQPLERANGLAILAMLTQRRGQLVEAMKLQVQAIALRSSVVTGDHPFVARGPVLLAEMELESGEATEATKAQLISSLFRLHQRRKIGPLCGLHARGQRTGWYAEVSSVPPTDVLGRVLGGR